MKQLVMVLIYLLSMGTLFCVDDGLRRKIIEQQNKAARVIQIAWLRHHRVFWKRQCEVVQCDTLDLQSKIARMKLTIYRQLSIMSRQTAELEKKDNEIQRLTALVDAKSKIRSKC